MPIASSDTLAVHTAGELVAVRQKVRQWSIDAGFSLVEQTKMVTAASELARNMVTYAGGGTLTLEMLEDGVRKGVRLTFKDCGPGIADLNQALRDGFSTGNGMGLGLGGARRLSNEFDITSRPGEGTRVTITRWRGEK